MDLFLTKDGIVHKHSKCSKVDGLPFKEFSSSGDNCVCNLNCNLKEKNKSYTVYRKEGDVTFTFDEMVEKMCILLMNDWTMYEHRIVPNGKTFNKTDVYKMLRALKGPAMRPIRPYLHTNRALSGSSLKVNLDVLSLYQVYDVYYLSRLSGTRITLHDCRQIWQAPKEGGNYILDKFGCMGLPWDTQTSGSLAELCLRRLSAFNQVYGGRNHTPNLSYTMENLHAKLFPAIEKLNKPVHSVMGNAGKLGAVTPYVMDVMCKLLDVEKFKQTQVWDFDTELEKSAVMPLASSAGLRAGPTKIFEMDGAKFKVTVGGKKAIHIEYSTQELRRMKMDYMEHKKVVLRDRAWCLVPKNEILAGTTDAEMEKFMNKLRLFNIPGVVLARAQRMVHSYRQNIERGHHIAIGISFWHGGAQIFAERLHYNKQGYKWYTGDFAAYDNTLKAQLLLIYSYFTMYYYRKEGDYGFFSALLKIVADNLTLKVVHIYGDIWKLIFGGMPSGAYETSHGDSWIAMFMFVHFFLSIGHSMPRYGMMTKKLLLERLLMFFIYGDDHVLAIPDSIAPIMNLELFSKFAKDYYQVELRDIVVTERFFSEIDDSTGNLRIKGVNFLSRYFVRRESVTSRTDLPEVLPYRETVKVIKKFAYGDGGTRLDIDYVLAAIGMAYDSFGTNAIAYEFCHFMYVGMLKKIGVRDFFDLLQQNKDYIVGVNLNSILKKCGITVDELRHGFPSRESLLDRHIMDKSKHVLRDEVVDFSQIFL